MFIKYRFEKSPKAILVDKQIARNAKTTDNTFPIPQMWKNARVRQEQRITAFLKRFTLHCDLFQPARKHTALIFIIPRSLLLTKACRQSTGESFGNSI